MGKKDGESARRRERIEAALRQLLPAHPKVTDRLARLVDYARLAAGEQSWWDTPKPRKLRRAASLLCEALDAFDYYERLNLQEVFNPVSVNIFRGFRIPADHAKDQSLREWWDEGYTHIDYIEKFVQQVRFVGRVGLKEIGRPKEDVRLRVAVKAAKMLLEDRIKPSKSDAGVFADQLRIIFREGGLPVPDNMFLITQHAMRAVEELAGYDSDLARALQEARPVRRPPPTRPQR